MKNYAVLALMTFSINAFSASIYDCQFDSGNHSDNVVVLVEADKAAVTSTNSHSDMTFMANLDKNYRSTGAPKIRFKTKIGYYTRNVVVSARMLQGSKNGFVTISGTEDSFWSSSFKCNKR